LVEKNKSLPEAEEPKFLRYVNFFSRHKWRIVACVSLVVAVLVVIGFVQLLRRRSEARAFEAYHKAESAEQHRSVSENFSGTFYGSVSLIEAGNLLFEKEKFAEARKLYMRFLGSYRESRLRPWVYNRVGAAFEAERKYDQAIEYYRKAEATPWLRFQAKLNIGRCYEFKGDVESEKNPQAALENYDMARTYYRQLTEGASASPGQGPGLSPWQQQAQSRMAFLRDKERKARETPSEKKVDKGQG